jgi:hypothetical protein
MPLSQVPTLVADTIGDLLRHAYLRLAKHLGPLAGLVVLHVAVFQRSLRGSNGIPDLYVPYDFFNSYARILIFISDSLRAGALPLWFPYGHAGTPFVVNPQSQLWSPLTWLVSLTIGYDPLVVQQQQFLIMLAGSVGVYFLGYNLWAHRASALLAAVAFNFTSARLCNAQHMDIVTAFSLFPWVLYGIRRLAQGQWLATPLLGAIGGVLVVSGYPGVVLLSPLWFLCWAGWCMVTECNERGSRKRFVLGLALGALIAIGISAGYWLPIVVNIGSFTRGQAFSTDAALTQSLFVGDIWHLLYGASTRITPEAYTTDVSMRGLYFGVVALGLGVYAVLFKRGSAVTALALGFVLAFVLSVGRYTFVRVALHDCLNFLNYSRFPSVDSRAVASLAGSLLAGAGLSYLREDGDAKRRLLRIFTTLVLLMLVGLIWLKNVIYPGIDAPLLAECFNNAVTIEMLMLAAALVVVVRSAKPTGLAFALLAIAALDAATHTNTDVSLYALTSKTEMQRLREIHSPTFDAAKALVPRIDSPSLMDGAANDAFLNKSFYLASYSPFQLKQLDVLLDNGFKPFLLSGARVVGFPGADPPKDGARFVQKATPVDFQILQYSPSRVQYAVHLPQRTLLVFNEMYFPGWRARVDGKSVGAMREVAGGLRGLVVEAGRHTIVTRFLPTSFVIGGLLTLLSWVCVLGWLVRAGVRARRLARATIPAAS